MNKEAMDEKAYLKWTLEIANQEYSGNIRDLAKAMYEGWNDGYV